MSLVQCIEQWVSRPVFRTAYAMGLTGLVVFSVLVWVRGGPARQYTAQAAVKLAGPVNTSGQAREIVDEMSAAVHDQMRLWCNQVAPAVLAWDIGERGGQAVLRVTIDVTAPSTGAACATANAAALEVLKTGRRILAAQEGARQRRRLESALEEARHYETKARHAVDPLTAKTEDLGSGSRDQLGTVAELDAALSRRQQAEMALRLAAPMISRGRWASQRAQVVARSSGRPTVATTVWTLVSAVGVACLIGTWIVRGRLYRVWTSAREVESSLQTPVLASLSRHEVNPLVPRIQSWRRVLDGWITGCEFGIAIILLLIVIFAAMGNQASADLVRDPLAMLAQRFTPVSYGTP
ncbi:MAG: hypothetical protein VX346_19040 [Planctomycetota bacterium]|nr:hypothetical protein [Planctomycetota bacterium]